MAISDQYSAAWMPEMGSVLDDRYEVVSKLDKGGMGVVLRGYDTKFEREVAIKMVSPKLAKSGNYRDRFEREVDLATRIEHPNVIRCHDFGVTDDGALFLVMELLDGFPLKQYIRNEARLSTKRTMEIALQALDGLSAAHEQDVIHRDLKPGNIYLTEDHRGRPRVKLLDFGLARSLSSDDIRLTQTGAICGTAAYVAPETLVVAEPGKPGDVYAMGLVILEMLFGRRVYQSKQMAQTFMEQLVVPARIPQRLWDEPLGRIIVRALQKHPGERYPDATAMYDALAAITEQTTDFVLANEEIPPSSTELPRELLDDLADGRYRTIDTLHKMPHPRRWEPSDADHVDDRETLNVVLEEISRTDMDAAFDTIMSADGTPRLESVKQAIDTASLGQTPETDSDSSSEKKTIQVDGGEKKTVEVNFDKGTVEVAEKPTVKVTPDAEDEPKATVPYLKRTDPSPGPALDPDQSSERPTVMDIDEKPTAYNLPSHKAVRGPQQLESGAAQGVPGVVGPELDHDEKRSLLVPVAFGMVALVVVAASIAAATWFVRQPTEVTPPAATKTPPEVEQVAAKAVPEEEPAAGEVVVEPIIDEEPPSQVVVEEEPDPVLEGETDVEATEELHEPTVAEPKPAAAEKPRPVKRKRKAPRREQRPEKTAEADKTESQKREKIAPEVADDIVDKYMPEL